MTTKPLIELWDAKLAIKMMEGVSSTRTAIVSLMFPNGGTPVNSYELPLNYLSDQIENVPMCYASNQPEPIAITQMTAKNMDIGSFFIVKQYTKRENDQMIQLLNSNKQGETARSMQNATNLRQRYTENFGASGLTGKATAQTRDKNGALVDFELTLGTLGTIARTAASWASAGLDVMLNDLESAKEGIEANFGDIDIPVDELMTLCSRQAFNKIYALRAAKQKIDIIDITTGRFQGFRYIEIDGYKLYDISGKYRDTTGSASNAVADNYIQMIWNNPTLGHGYYFLAIDNFELDAPFKALPMISYMMDGENKKTVKQLWESRPIIVYNIKAMEKMLVIS